MSKGKLKRLPSHLWGSLRSKGKDLYLVEEIEYGNVIYKLGISKGKVRRKVVRQMSAIFEYRNGEETVSWSGKSEYERFRGALKPLAKSPVAKRALLKRL